MFGYYERGSRSCAPFEDALEREAPTGVYCIWLRALHDDSVALFRTQHNFLALLELPEVCVGLDLDWSNAARAVIAGALSQVPAVGPILQGLCNTFWPQNQPSIWSQVETQVQELLNETLAQFEQEQVLNDLTGLGNVLSSYLDALGTNAAAGRWTAADTLFLQLQPTFQSPSYALALLPLFAQFANMYLALLRDGVINGAQWGWDALYQQLNQQKLEQTLTLYASYANSTYQKGLWDLQQSTQANNNTCEPFATVNAYVRGMTLTVLDFVQLWQYFDPALYPNPVEVIPTREIYSDPLGTCDDSGNIVLPTAPTQPIQQITVWGWDRIDAVQLTYPANGGPGGCTVTPRMGDSSGGSNQAPHGGVVNVVSNPVVTAGALAGDIVNAMMFTFQDGTSATYGGNYPGGGATNFSYPSEVLSSIHINGVSAFYKSADCVVFGFMFPADAPLPAAAVKTLAVTRSKAITPESLTGAPTDPIQGPIAAAIRSGQFEAEHQAFWAEIHARAVKAQG